MSIKLMSQVWDCDIGHAEQAILMALADHASDDGTKVYPSIRRTSWKTGYSERQVQRVLRSLERLGAVEIVHPGGGVFATEYRIHLRSLPKKAALVNTGVKMSPLLSTGDKSQCDPPSECHPTGDIAVSPQSSSNHPLTTKREDANKLAVDNSKDLEARVRCLANAKKLPRLK